VGSGADIGLRSFRPKSQLVSTQNAVSVPCHRVIDAHNHLGQSFGGGWSNRSASELLDVLDMAHVETYVDLDGGWGEDILEHRLDKFKNAAPERFSFFGGPNWKHWQEQGNKFGEFAAARLKLQAARGAEGLKIWKDFGLHVQDQYGKLVTIDDQRLDPLWQAAAELNLPVIIHIADPVAFFDPIDGTNERWEELQAQPDWHFPAGQFPPFNSLIDAFAKLVERHSNTIFIGAHVGCYSENLAWVSALLDRCSNFNVDISARISELGRQPYSAKRFFERYADRILFGIDAGPSLETYQTYWRFLETQDEYFNYSSEPIPPQGRWQISGLGLGPDVLNKVYYANAKRLIVNKKSRELQG
jgi:predicted TIM-barrel fold metal-dependent hydrolase